MPNVKKYLMTSIILGSIAMASGLLIGATNLVTSGPIAEYEQTQINNGIKEVFKGYDNIHYAKDEDVEQTDEKCSFLPFHDGRYWVGLFVFGEFYAIRYYDGFTIIVILKGFFIYFS